MKHSGLVPHDVTYIAIILGLSKQGRPCEALRLYDEMIEAGITPNEWLYSSVAGSLDTAASISSVLKIISVHFVTISAMESGPNFLASPPPLCPPLPLAFSGNNRYEAWEPGPWFSEEKNSGNVDRLVHDFWTPIASLAWLIEFVR
ncbi:hypothetical protein Dsin_003315 [Dipteronia sinensis]|uniref:Pentatricopeptide repeat-containing protein n=1 Tax=Dipteronia sinensis TaxID=43782 RepID=A0AAE0B8Q4_9ROSI|nr:hypothetical protein Dsin_003315 [Dipteronia sinensis]